jgi:hypothetical protein
MVRPGVRACVRACARANLVVVHGNNTTDAYYRVVSYVVSKIVADVPAAIISALSYSAILYPSVGLHAGAPSFFFFALATFVNLMIATLVGCGGAPAAWMLAGCAHAFANASVMHCSPTRRAQLHLCLHAAGRNRARRAAAMLRHAQHARGGLPYHAKHHSKCGACCAAVRTRLTHSMLVFLCPAAPLHYSCRV